jgi:hypothetical protein
VVAVQLGKRKSGGQAAMPDLGGVRADAGTIIFFHSRPRSLKGPSSGWIHEAGANATAGGSKPVEAGVVT